MNETLISGLLGAIMGGSSSIEKSIAEEMAAKQKEEEEKRREERALTLAERQEAMREAREKRQEEAKRMAAEKERQAIAQTAPSKAPETGIVGNAIDEYQGEIANTGYTGQTRQATPEEALRWSIGKAREEGREDLAKQREEALYKMLKEGRESAKEAREQEEFGRGKPEKKTPQMQNVEALAKEIYGGDDPERIAQARRQAINRIFPEREARGAGGEKPPKPPTTADYGKARNTLQRDVERLSTVMKDNKIVRDPFLYEAINSVVSRELKKDKDRVFEAGLADEARAEVVSALESARSEARRELEKTTGADGKPLSKDTLRRNKEILANPISLERYENENAKKYMSRYLGGGKAEEPKRGGKPWERSWGSME